MMSWTLFILHKLIMIVILYSSVRIIFGKDKLWHTLLVSGFLLTQSVFGNCIVTSLENIVRPMENMAVVTNSFILEGILGATWTPYGRIIFAGLAVLLLINYYDLRKYKRKVGN